MKIKDICEYGAKSKINAGRGLSEGSYPFYTSSAVCNKYLDDAQFLEPGIIMGTGGNTTLHYCSGNFSVSTDCLVLFPKRNIETKYLYYFFKSNIHVLDAGFKGAGLKHTSKTYINEIEIKKIPQRLEQLKVVKILDSLQEIINKKEEQLLQLDALIKSRFVEMFGDPIYNSKLLPVIELGKACDMKAGKFKRAENIRNDFEENLYPCFGGNGIRGYVEDYTHEGSIPIIGRQGALCGNVQFATGKFYATEHAIVTQTKIGWNSLWLYIMLHEMDLNRFASGAAQPGLNVSTLVTLEVINPEVELQNEYAEFVQSAYKLKFKIQKSLEESQMLFNSLMQKYFE